MAKIIKKKGTVRENIEAIILAILIALFIRTFIIQSYKIPSGSMKDTLLIGDHILVNKFIYGIRIPFSNKTIVPIFEPKRGDIAVFRYPEDRKKDFIKRVIAIEGDIVEIKNKKVFINNKEIQNEKAVFKDSHFVLTRDDYGPVKIPEDSIFVLGDNRDHSHDSRFWGFVNLKDLRGKALVIFWSWNKEKSWPRWNRIGKIIK